MVAKIIKIVKSMDSEYISREDQGKVINKLARTGDYVTALRLFNEQYASKLGHRVGDAAMKSTDFARLMHQTHYRSEEVERFTEEVTGQKGPDLESL